MKVLDAGKVPTRHRSQWIAENAPGIDVLISHPQPIRTGLTLFDAQAGTTFRPSSSRKPDTTYSRCVKRHDGHGGSGNSTRAAYSFCITRRLCRHGLWH